MIDPSKASLIAGNIASNGANWFANIIEWVTNMPPALNIAFGLIGIGIFYFIYELKTGLVYVPKQIEV